MGYSKKYDAATKIALVEEYKTSGKTKTDFAFEKGIPDSTFFDWIKKYEKNPTGFCNITGEIKKIKELDNKDMVMVPLINGENNAALIRLTYNGATIEFSEGLLPKVMETLRLW